VWNEEERWKGQAWGLKTIESFHTPRTPPVRDEAAGDLLTETSPGFLDTFRTFCISRTCEIRTSFEELRARN
jgi:hypothetical protein